MDRLVYYLQPLSQVHSNILFIATLLKYILLLFDAVTAKIKSLIPSKFGLIFDPSHTTHYLALYEIFSLWDAAKTLSSVCVTRRSSRQLRMVII